MKYLLLEPLCLCVCARVHAQCTLSCVLFFETPWTVAHQAPLSWDFPGKNTGVGCCADLPDPGIGFASLVPPALACRCFSTAPPGKP